jgi:hypothetical protein
LDKSKAKVVLSSTWRYDPVGVFAAKYWHIPFVDVMPDMRVGRAEAKYRPG